MIVLSSLLRRVVYPAMSGANLLSRRLRAGEVAVLTYHGVLPEGVRGGTSPAEVALVSAAQFAMVKGEILRWSRTWKESSGTPVPERSAALAKEAVR